MRTLYAIGDIHGQLGALDHALSLIAQDGGANASIIFLGDYVDRGADSRAVIDLLIDGFATRNWRGVRGNHDRMFTRFVRDAVTMDPRIKSNLTWLHPRLGGTTTLASYFDVPDHPALEDFGRDPSLKGPTEALAKQARAIIPDDHLAFLDGLPLMIEEPGLIFVHAGINPRLPLGLQDEDDLIWIRDGWLDYTGPLRTLVVHGHTALDRPQHHGNRVNLDGGAGYGRPLVPVAIETDGTVHRFFTLSASGRSPLNPV